MKKFQKTLVQVTETKNILLKLKRTDFFSFIRY